MAHMRKILYLSGLNMNIWQNALQGIHPLTLHVIEIVLMIQLFYTWLVGECGS